MAGMVQAAGEGGRGFWEGPGGGAADWILPGWQDRKGLGRATLYLTLLPQPLSSFVQPLGKEVLVHMNLSQK